MRILEKTAEMSELHICVIWWMTNRFFIFAIFILHSRESDCIDIFRADVRTRLRVAISEVSGPPVFHIKAGRPV